MVLLCCPLVVLLCCPPVVLWSCPHRDRYVTGEFRFRQGSCRTNPRKMVKMWAEKEMRNLKRIHQAGIVSPLPLLLRSHVLVMEFFGSDGSAAPRLKVLRSCKF